MNYVLLVQIVVINKYNANNRSDQPRLNAQLDESGCAKV